MVPHVQAQYTYPFQWINHEGGEVERGRGGDGNMVMAHMVVTAPWRSLTPCAKHLLSNLLI